MTNNRVPLLILLTMLHIHVTDQEFRPLMIMITVDRRFTVEPTVSEVP